MHILFSIVFYALFNHRNFLPIKRIDNIRFVELNLNAMKKNASNDFTQNPEIVDYAKIDSLKATEKAVELFYKKLSIPPKNELPVGNFKLFDYVEIKETANAGV